MNFGYSCRLNYDPQTYSEKIEEITAPITFRMNLNNIANQNACFTSIGPISSYNGHGVSYATYPEPGYNAVKQDLVALESILSNRNVKMSKSRSGKVNPFNLNSIKLTNVPQCNNFLHPEFSRLSDPSSNHREIAVDRFVDLPRNPQNVIFWDFASNTRLQAKDSYVLRAPKLQEVDPSLPQELMYNIADFQTKNGNCNNTPNNPSNCQKSIYCPVGSCGKNDSSCPVGCNM
jgi:hypothetical protein